MISAHRDPSHLPWLRSRHIDFVCSGHGKEDAEHERHLRDAAKVQGAARVAVEARLQDVHGQHPRQAQGAGECTQGFHTRIAIICRWNQHTHKLTFIQYYPIPFNLSTRIDDYKNCLAITNSIGTVLQRCIDIQHFGSISKWFY